MRTPLVFLGLVACQAPGAVSIDAAIPDDDAALDTSTVDDSFTIVALPDTQYYNGDYAWVFDDQTSWIAAHAQDKHIQLVLGLGDIVDGGGPPPTGSCTVAPPSTWQAQWTSASAAADRLDGVVPYMFAIGNHDYDCEADRPQPRSASHFAHYFGPARYTGKPWFNGAFEPQSPANFWNVFTVGGHDLLVLALEFYPTNTDLAWANSVLDAHADVPAILITHAFLYYDDAGPATAHRVTTGDVDSAASYKLGTTCPETNITTCGNGNNGSDMWTKLVSKHANITMVLSGHFRLPSPGNAYPAKPAVPPENGVGRRVDTTPLGNRVVQVLSDYQGQGRNGYFGNGYLRLYTFKPHDGVLHVSTYSPAVEMHPDRFPAPGIPLDPATDQPALFKTDEYNAFELPLE